MHTCPNDLEAQQDDHLRQLDRLSKLIAELNDAIHVETHPVYKQRLKRLHRKHTHHYEETLHSLCSLIPNTQQVN